eukprot:s2043_g4.t1
MEKMIHKEGPEAAMNSGIRILTQIKEEMDIDHVSFLGLFKERNLRKRVLIACTLVIGQQATGVNAFLGLVILCFARCGIENPILFNSVFNSIMIFGCIAGLLLVDSKYGGRRCQLLVATAMMGPPLVVAGLALQFQWPGIITMVTVIIYGVGFQFAWGTIPWIYPAEIFSMAEKESAVSLAVGVNYVANAAIIYITPALMKPGSTWTEPGTLLFFGALNVLNAIFVLVYIKETKGVALEHIPDLFRDEVSKQRPRYEIQLAFALERKALLGGLMIIIVWNLHPPQPSHREMPDSFSDAKRRRGLLAGAFVMIGLVLVVVFGVLGMECPWEPEVGAAQVTSLGVGNETDDTNDANNSDATGRQLQSNNSNSTDNQTMEVTTTQSPLFVNFTDEEMRTAQAVLYTLHGDFTGKCIYPTGEEPMSQSVDAPGSDCQLLCSLHEDCTAYSQDKDLETCLHWKTTGLTGHGNGGGFWSCVTKQQVYAPRECAPTDIVVVDGRIIEAGPQVRCGCSGAFDRGLWGPVSATAEQVASVWCNIGMAASFMFGLVGFFVHSFACSMAVEHCTASQHRVTLRRLVTRQVRPIDDGEGEVENNQSMVAWTEAPRDDNPKPVAQFGTNRMFSV